MLQEDGSAPVDRRKARGERSRAKVLGRAASIASIDGLEGLTIGRLATEAGVSKGAIQALFGDKEALQLATIGWVGGLVAAEVVGPALDRKNPLARLRALVEGWFAFVERRSLPGGCFMNAVGSEYRARPGPIRDEVARRREAKRALYRATIFEAQHAGEIGAGVDAETLAMELLAFQALANVAFALGDHEEFDRARALSRRRIDEAAG